MKTTNRLFSRAAIMLLLMMLTAMTTWAAEVTAVYAVIFNTTTKKTTLRHNGGNYESVTWDYMYGTNSTPWNAGATHGVDDGYGITFKPNKYLTLVGSAIVTSAETKFTVTVGASGYYIKSASIGGVTETAGQNAKTVDVTVPSNTAIQVLSVTLIRYYTVTPASGLTVTSGATVTEGNTKYYKAGTTVTIAPTSQYKIVEGTGGTGSATVSVAADKRSFWFTMPEQNVSPSATLTEVYTVTPASGLQVTSTAYFTYSNTKYYKPYTTVTVAPTNQYHIVEGTGGMGSAAVSVATDKRSFWFDMPAQDVSPSATLTEVHTISSPSGLTVSTRPYFTYNSTTYYKKGETYTLTADADKAIQSLTATGGATSDVAADKRSATVTIGSSDVTVSATFQTIRGTTTDGLSWSLALDGSNNYTRLTISGTGTMKDYGHNGDSWYTDAPWGNGVTSVTIAGGVTSIGKYAFNGCRSLATATIGNSVTVIGQKAFDHCDALTTVTLPASVTSLHQGAFYNCVNLERIDIGHDGAVSLAGQVFENDNALQYIVFPSIEAEQANTTGNWSAFDKKRRAKFGNRHFGVTTETGTAVYAIATGDDLRNFSAAVNAGNKGSGKTFLQTANIDLASGGNFPMIGTYTNQYTHFGGTYDGGGHTISGLTVSKDDINVGLFSDVDGGTVRDVILVSPTVTNTYTIDKNTSAGALVGCLSSNSIVENCHAISPNVSFTGTGDEAKYLGALIGALYNESTVTNCYYYGGNQSNAIGFVRGNNVNVTRVSAAHLVTLGDGVSIQTEMAADLGFSYDSDGNGQAENYWREGAELALADLPTADPGQHYRYAYTYGSTVLSGTTLTVADQDYTVAIIQQPIDWASQSSGDDAEHAYMIYTKDQLLLLAHRVNGTHGETANAYKGKFFKLGADIAFEHADSEGDNYAENYEAIGGYYNDSWLFFGGDFDGDGYTISGIRINKNFMHLSAYDQGLFGLINGDANIHDVHLTDAHIKGYSYVGGIVGENRHGTISGCTVTESTITAANNDCGTICGINGNGTLSHNYYRHCTVNGIANATGKGCKGADITANQGAMPAYLVTLGDGVSIVTEMADDLGFSYHGTDYWRVGAELTLGSNAPIGYGPVYSANGTALSGYTYTVNSSDGDVTLTATTDYSIITYTITYHAGGGVTFSTDKNSYTIKSADITLDTPTREGYTFLGWYDNKELTGTAVETIAAGSTGNKEFWAKWDIPYIDANGNTQYRSNYTELTNATDIGNLSAGWYVVTENVSYSSQFLCRSGDIHLILCDGAKMTVENSAEAIEMTNGSSLTIYAQSTGSSMGQLAATASHYSGIDVIDGSITICGGNITAKGSSGYASIFAQRSITIHSGQVNASGDSGIRSDGTITLGLRNATDYITATSYRGTVNIAQGQTLTDGTAFYSGNNVSIPGGKTLRPLETLDLSDNGNNAEAISEAAAVSTVGRVRNVTLSGRTIYRDGDWNTLCLPFALSAEQMAASPLSGATIMELDGAGSHLTDGTLTLNFNAATEMEAGRPYIVKWPLARTITTSGDWKDFADDVAAGNTYEGKIVRLAANIVVSEMVGTSEYKFKGIFDGQGHTLTLNSLSVSGEAACAPFRYVEGATIANLHTTGTVIADNNDASKFRSGLVGRSEGNTTIHNCWSSVTIQSSISGDGTHGGFIGVSDSGNATISNCCFDGRFIGLFTNRWGGFVGWSSSTTTISNSVFAPAEISIDQTSCATFSRNQVSTTNCYYSQALYDGSNSVTNGATAIGSRSAGELAAALGSGWQVEDGKAVPVTVTMDIVNPVFNTVTIDDTNRDVAFTGGSFKGTYASIPFNVENKSILLLGDNSTLYWPQSGASIGACRAYFQLSDPVVTVRQFVLNFGDDSQQTGIRAPLVKSEEVKSEEWYSLDGRKLDGKPTKKGLYINNGRKVVVK